MEYRTKQALETVLEAIQDYYKDGCQFYGQKIHIAVDRIKLVLLSDGQKANSESSVLPIVRRMCFKIKKMKYKVFKVKYEVDNYEKDPVKFFVANLTYGDCFDTIEEARENIEKYGEDYVQYYIMPYVYMV